MHTVPAELQERSCWREGRHTHLGHSRIPAKRSTVLAAQKQSDYIFC